MQHPGDWYLIPRVERLSVSKRNGSSREVGCRFWLHSAQCSPSTRPLPLSAEDAPLLLARLRALTGLVASSELPARADAFYSRLPGLTPPHQSPRRPHSSRPPCPTPVSGQLPPTHRGGRPAGRTRAGSGGRSGSRRPEPESRRRGMPWPPGEGAGA